MVARKTLAKAGHPDNKLFVFLDSGAFTSWTQGEVIAVQDYIAFIKKHAHLIDRYASLDVLPGEPGRAPTQAEVEKSAAASYKNHQIMKKSGLAPIPVFHRGESFAWLHKYLDDGEPYLGISPLATTANRTAELWLDEVFTILTDAQGKPLVKTHGFAMTKINLLFRYPWTTVDSTSWAIVAGYGRFLMPRWVNGKPDFRSTPYTIAVSEDNKTSKDSLYNMGKLTQERVAHYLEKYVGVTMAGVRNYYKDRQRANLYLLQQVEKLAVDVRFEHRIMGLHL